jgi:nifR3 family TIM-barrel protein
MSFWQHIEQPIIGLSPMDGVTDPAFRYIVARYGKPDVQFTEFVNVDEICYGVESAWTQLNYVEIERPVVAQIYGADPEKFYQVAQVICALGFDGVDINMGCPSKSVSARGCGAALIKNPPLAKEILRAARAGVEDWASGHETETIGLRPKVAEKIRSLMTSRGRRRAIPVSVKTRLGYDSVIIEDWVTVLLEERPEAISIHGRTLAQMYRGRADWEAIGRAAKLVRQTSTLILGNGDVESMQDVIDRVRATEVHGVLIGRGCLGHPWLFLQKAWAKGAIKYAAPQGEGQEGLPDSIQETSLRERFRVTVEHARYFEGLGGAQRFSAMRKHLGWYCKGFPGAAETRARMFQANNSADVQEVLGRVEHAQVLV